MPNPKTATGEHPPKMDRPQTFDPELLDEMLEMWGEVLTANIGMRVEGWEQRGLTTGQLRLMSILRDSPTGSIALGELAELMRVSPATITGITTRLVRRHLIERQADPADRRIIKVALTEDGARTLAGISVRGRQFYTDIFTHMGEQRTRELRACLRDFLEAAEAVKNEQSGLETNAVAG